MTKMKEKLLALPGDEIEIVEKSATTEPVPSSSIVIGPGLRKDNQNTIVAMKCGLVKKKDNFYWIDSYQKRVQLLTHVIVSDLDWFNFGIVCGQ